MLSEIMAPTSGEVGDAWGAAVFCCDAGLNRTLIHSRGSRTTCSAYERPFLLVPHPVIDRVAFNIECVQNRCCKIQAWWEATVYDGAHAQQVKTLDFALSDHRRKPRETRVERPAEGYDFLGCLVGNASPGVDFPTMRCDRIPESRIGHIAKHCGITIGNGLAQPALITLDSDIADIEFLQSIGQCSPNPAHPDDQNGGRELLELQLRVVEFLLFDDAIDRPPAFRSARYLA